MVRTAVFNLIMQDANVMPDQTSGFKISAV